jgi:hypothetical protein
MAAQPSRRSPKPGGQPASECAALTTEAAWFGVTPERVVTELALIAFADLARIAEWGPGWFRMKDSAELAKEDSAAISEVVVGGNGATRVKLFDKKAALVLLAQHLQMYERAKEQQSEGEARETEDPREFIVRRLAALAAGAAAERRDPAAARGAGEDISAPVEGLGKA